MACCEGLTVAERAAVMLLVGAAGVALWYAFFFHIWPSHVGPHGVDMWAVVISEHPDGSVECHAAVMHRMQQMSDVLYSGPYARGDFGNHASKGKSDELAARMVVNGTWRAPECGDVPP